MALQSRQTNYSIDKITCSIPLTEQDWDTLNQIDFVARVMPTLAKYGAVDIECNVYFYFDCSNENQAKEIIKALFSLLDKAQIENIFKD